MTTDHVPSRAMRTTAALIALALIVGGCGGDDDSPDDGAPSSEADLPALEDPYETITTALEDGGLIVCEEIPGSGDISGSYDSATFDVADGACVGDGTYVNVDLYNEPDTASTQFSTDDPVNRYVVWQLDPKTIASVTQSTPPGMLDKLKAAFSDYPSSGQGAA